MFAIASLLFCATLFAVYNREAIIEKCKDVRKLTKFVSTRYKTCGMIVWVSASIIGKLYWMKFLQWANNSVEYNNNKTITLTYVLKNKLYKIILPVGRGPPKVLLVTDEKHEDVSDTILPYIGADFDWHKTEFVPGFWGKESLTFELSNGETKTFGKDEVIVI